MAVDDGKPVYDDENKSTASPPDVDAEVVSMGDAKTGARATPNADSDAQSETQEPLVDLGGEPPLGDLNEDADASRPSESASRARSILTPLRIAAAFVFLGLVAGASFLLTRSDEESAANPAHNADIPAESTEVKSAPATEPPATELVLPSAVDPVSQTVNPTEKITNPGDALSAKEALQNLPPVDTTGTDLPAATGEMADEIDNRTFQETAKDALRSLEAQDDQRTEEQESETVASEPQIEETTVVEPSASEASATSTTNFLPDGAEAAPDAQPIESDVDRDSLESTDDDMAAPQDDAVNEVFEDVEASNSSTDIATGVAVADNAALIAAEESVRAANEEIAGLQSALQAANRQIAALEADLAQARLSFNAETMARENAASDEIADLRARLADAEARAARLPSEGAMISMMNALATGSPFADPLRSAGTIIQAETAPIAAYAASGVPTYAEIERGFEPAARKAVAADIRAKANGPVAQFFASIASLVVVRPAEPQAGNTLVARLSRAEAALENNDIGVALREVSPIDGKAREAMEPWIKDAEARLAADMIAERLASADAAFSN
jgi:hypothetical protein